MHGDTSLSAVVGARIEALSVQHRLREDMVKEGRVCTASLDDHETPSRLATRRVSLQANNVDTGSDRTSPHVA
jgi:hypothetical protein